MREQEEKIIHIDPTAHIEVGEAATGTDAP
jgi:hypothetical protein